MYIQGGENLITPRSEVYAALDGEREYQKKWGDLDDRNNISDFLCYMKRYYDEAVYQNSPDIPEPSLNAIRKLTALGVACMEVHGVPFRT